MERTELINRLAEIITQLSDKDYPVDVDYIIDTKLWAICTENIARVTDVD